MEILEWSDKLATGIPEIDNQHRRIVDMINQMRTAMERGDTEAVGRVIPDMADYTISHFAFEEALMEEAGYRFLMPHRRVHQLFARRLPEFQARYAAGEDILEELHTMLVRWLANHIQSEDRSYVATITAYMGLQAEKNSTKARKIAPAVCQTPPRPGKRPSLWRRLKGLFLAKP